MNAISPADHLLDRLALMELVRFERFCRDQGFWEALASCFTPDSYIRTTWFPGGTGREFADASREMAEVRKRHSKHFIHPQVVKVFGDRATVESYGEIHNRSDLDGVSVDMVQFCRFFSRAKRVDGQWKLHSFEGIYQWDTIAPVNPSDDVVLDWTEAEQLRAPYRIWAYALKRRGYTIDQGTIVADDRPDLVQQFYADAERWLHADDEGAIPGEA